MHGKAKNQCCRECVVARSRGDAYKLNLQRGRINPVAIATITASRAAAVLQPGAGMSTRRGAEPACAVIVDDPADTFNE